MTPLQEFEHALAHGWSVLLVGKSGRGKTYLAMHHQIDPANVISIPMTNETEELSLYGTVAFDVTTQSYKHIDGPLVQGVEQGKRVVVDEITDAPADVSHMWHQVANREPIRVKTDNFRTVAIHPNFQLVATSNLEGYAGNYRLSPAFYSRFHIIEWNGMTAEEETEFFCQRYPTLDPFHIADYVTLAHSLAQTIAVNNTEFVVSMREIERACSLYQTLATQPDEPFPHVSAFIKAVRRPCRLLAPDLINALDSLAEKSFKANYARAKARELERHGQA